ncbi:MAG: hypothetical protein KKE83_06870 [Proteobacteria bacterium]|nr:hypothetical protein [Bacteroidota bacterium]MBU2619393.1 hypothetical protein [Pseudomonadota bacterium]
MTPTPFYFDWQFWSAVAALIALFLSQLPPLHVIFRKAALGCEAFSRMHITHKVGNPNAQWHLIIENTGGRSLRVKGITLTFRKAGGVQFNLPAQSYLRTPDSTDSVMFTPFRLAPGEEWAHIITFFDLFSRDDEKEYRRLESDIRSDILSQKEDPLNKDKLCEANPATVEKLIAFFRRHFKWEHGEYEFELTVITNIEKANINRKFRFSLFETESNELAGYSEMYRIGAGVYWVSSAQPGLIVPVHEK